MFCLYVVEYNDIDTYGVFNVQRSCSVNAALTLLRSCEGVLQLAGMKYLN